MGKSDLMMPSRVLLYGRELDGLSIDVTALQSGLGKNNFLRSHFEGTGNEAPRFAQIYGFEFEGHYHDLLVPTFMLVHGAGSDPADPATNRIEVPKPELGPEMKVWQYDKDDFSMRLDPSSGPLESILLEAELDDEELSLEMAGRKVSGRKVGGYLGRGRKVSGRKVGIRGRKVRGD